MTCCDNQHQTYGEHLRSKNLRIGYCRSAFNFDLTRAKRVERELAEYASARAQGIQPAGTQLHQTRHALDMSDSTGSAFDATVGP